MGLTALTIFPMIALGVAATRAAEPPKAQLSAPERLDFYHLAEGSEIFPIDWLRAMVSQRTNKPFLDNLDRFGLIDDPDGPLIPGEAKKRLPIGLTLARPRGSTMEMIGVNCASCHTGELRLKQEKIRIDGGPNLFDISGFYEDMFLSAAATAQDHDRFVQFLTTLKANGPRDSPTLILVGLLPFLQQKESDRSPSSAEAILHDRIRSLLKKEVQPLEQKLGELLGAKDSDQRKSIMLELAKLQGQAQQESEQFRLLLENAGGLGSLIRRLDLGALRLLEARIVFLRKIQHLQTYNGVVPKAGPGRVDAFASARNFLFDPADAVAPDAPVRFPSIWDLSNRHWFHWDGNTNSIFERNVGQSLGLGAIVDPKTLTSTIIPANLHRLEKLAGKIPVPSWPDAFGKIDIESPEFKAGKKVYAANCASCHDGTEKIEAGDVLDAGGKVIAKKWSVAGKFLVYDVGTDPARTKSFQKPMRNGAKFADALGLLQRQIKEKSFLDNAAELELIYGSNYPNELDPLGGKSEWLTTGGYVARPLAGCWATAPFLHNGSVPTIADLLSPAGDRPAKFPVGHREYDPKLLGFVTQSAAIPPDQQSAVWSFDTSKDGNRNVGHEFGTKLSADEKQWLLFYLKMLK
jgi:hypothetical protein